MSRQTTGHFTYANWEEREVGPSEGYPRLGHASVTNTFTGGIEATDTTCEYTIGYGTETTGTFTGMEVLAGRLDGREGTFEVVAGTGTGELAGLRGTGSFTARHGEPSCAYTFAYDLG
ncbi:DUF3224 domain-containing protein [Streptomyces celluloflavus]|uniref:DUF3224 domain-containing protein n=1 Tax=Streptomyces celluloflavus TaxID=58344 RepID=UPI0036D1E2DE